jgi:hypothetical protein
MNIKLRFILAFVIAIAAGQAWAQDLNINIIQV